MAVIAVTVQGLPVARPLDFTQAATVVVHQPVALLVVQQVAFSIGIERLAGRVVGLQGMLRSCQDEAVVGIESFVCCTVGKIGVALCEVIQLVVDEKLTLDSAPSCVVRQGGASATVFLQPVECIVVEGFQQQLFAITDKCAAT